MKLLKALEEEGSGVNQEELEMKIGSIEENDWKKD